jgi:predicted small secreted protein
MRKLIFAALIMAAPLVVACNTVEGAGKDVAKVGDHVQKRAEQVKNGN